MSLVAPTSIAAVLDVLAAEPDRDVIAGGTDLMVELNFDRRVPGPMVSLHRVDELRVWSERNDEVRIGAGVTCATLERPPFTELVPVLAQAARTVGSPQIRNAATIGGNLATASPAGDLLPALSALDATVVVARRGAERAISIHDFLVAPKRSALEPGEIIVAVLVPISAGGQEFVKVGTRNAMVIAIASVAMVRRSEWIAVALGSVGPTVLRARAAEAWFADRGCATGAVDEFADRVAAEARPIDDHRSTAAYRRHAVRVCANRAARRILGAAP